MNGIIKGAKQMADFVEVGKINDLNDGMMKRVYTDGKDILLAKVNGKYYAAAGRCPHMKGMLANGKLKGTVVTCPVHGSRFDFKRRQSCPLGTRRRYHVLYRKIYVGDGIGGENRKTVSRLRGQD